ncbi:hypothetical protein MKY54_01640 [Paenibacillus sp. FSL P2-0121]|uniref:AsnC family protein n=1 Tax=Paenibacillus sp. FSL P2-0121 TaxID=2921626 RepID=UPI0030D17039
MDDIDLQILELLKSNGRMTSSASGVLLSHSSSNMSFLVSGVFLGSALWWMGLTGSTALFRINIMSGRSKQLMFNKLSGLVMLSFGVVSLIQSLNLQEFL